jgi:hypothetical protein
VITITVQYQFFYSWPPYRGRHRDPPLSLWVVQNGVWVRGGRGGKGRAIVLITSRWGRAVSKQVPHLPLALNPPPVTFSPGLYFAFLLAAVRPFFDNMLSIWYEQEKMRE